MTTKNLILGMGILVGLPILFHTLQADPTAPNRPNQVQWVSHSGCHQDSDCGPGQYCWDNASAGEENSCIQSGVPTYNGPISSGPSVQYGPDHINPVTGAADPGYYNAGTGEYYPNGNGPY